MIAYAHSVAMHRVGELTMEADDGGECFILSILHKLIVSPSMVSERDMKDLELWLRERSGIVNGQHGRIARAR